MAYDMFSSFEQTLVGTFGSYLMMAILLTLFFVVVLMIIGIDFRYSLLISSLIFVGFSEAGWLPLWIEAMAWVIVIGYGALIAWNMIIERY